jgi:MarR family transcriptional regulator, lower aerobic nicotinate degradation pathway regulator
MTSRSAKPARASGSGKKANGLDKRRISKRTSSKHNIVRSKSLKKSYVLERQVGFQLRLAVQRHTAIFVANMVLTQTQFATIVKLSEVGPCSQNHLARLVALDAATINGVLDRLTKRGYVSATPDLHDARQRVIVVTSLGKSIVERAVKIAKKITEETLTPLSAMERAQLSRLLTKIS